MKFLVFLLVAVITFIFWSANNGDQKIGLNFAAVSVIDAANVDLRKNFALAEAKHASAAQKSNEEELKKIASEVAASAAEDVIIKKARLIMNAH